MSGLARWRPWRRGQSSWTPGFFERQYDRLLELLRIEVWCSRCSDLCVSKQERRTRTCVHCRMIEEAYP